MTNLKPYNPPPAQLSAGARFIRVFTRIGAAAAVLIALIGLATTGFLAFDKYTSTNAGFTNAQCVAKLVRAGYQFKPRSYSSALNYEVEGCSDTGLYYKTVAEVMEIAGNPFVAGQETASVVGYGLLITGFLAVVAYLAFWCIGWMCAGFTRDA